MRKTCLVVTMFVLVSLSGCIAIVKNDGCPKITKDCIAMASTCAEINAVEKMSSEQPKIEGFKAIAQRHDLSGPERVELIKALDKSNIPQPAKEEILLTLLRNHSPEDPAKKPQDTPCK